MNWRAICRAVGSLWLAAVLLLLLMVAMASATVYEATHSTAGALRVFYGSWWFSALMAMLGVNVLASLLVRLPLTRRQIGFAITHVSVLVILAGAAVTTLFGMDAQIGLTEGETVGAYRVRQDAITLSTADGATERTIDLTGKSLGNIRGGNHAATPILKLGGIEARVVNYLPDSIEEESIVADPAGRPAVRVVLAAGGRKMDQWLFAHDQGGPHETVAFREIRDPAELEKALHPPPPATQPGSIGSITIQIGDTTQTLAVEDCRDTPVAIEGTSYKVQVVRYLPHAMVSERNQLENASDRPVNPAVIVEFTGPEGTFRRPAFARFPEFSSMHGKDAAETIELTFTTETADTGASAPLALFQGPEGRLYARLTPEGGEPVVQSVRVGEPVETPWPGIELTIEEHLPAARRRIEAVAPEQPRETKTPAVELAIQHDQNTERFWLRKYTARNLIGDDEQGYRIRYADKQIPLGFRITLDRFRIGRYPGTQRPRSFESSVTFFDPATGRAQSDVISMNNPAEHGPYTFYQSSYREDPQTQQMISFLSVAWDPGQPIVFAGYLGMMLGMLWVLIQRLIEQRRKGDKGVAPAAASASEVSS